MKTWKLIWLIFKRFGLFHTLSSRELVAELQPWLDEEILAKLRAAYEPRWQAVSNSKFSKSLSPDVEPLVGIDGILSDELKAAIAKIELPVVTHVNGTIKPTP